MLGVNVQGSRNLLQNSKRSRSSITEEMRDEHHLGFGSHDE